MGIAKNIIQVITYILLYFSLEHEDGIGPFFNHLRDTFRESEQEVLAWIFGHIGLQSMDRVPFEDLFVLLETMEVLETCPIRGFTRVIEVCVGKRVCTPDDVVVASYYTRPLVFVQTVEVFIIFGNCVSL